MIKLKNCIYDLFLSTHDSGRDIVVHFSIRLFRRFRFIAIIFYKILMLLVKVFKSASNLEMCYWVAFKLHKNILYHIFSESHPFSVKIVICNTQFTHFSTGVDFEFLVLFLDYYFQIEVFGSSFCKCLQF